MADGCGGQCCYVVLGRRRPTVKKQRQTGDELRQPLAQHNANAGMCVQLVDEVTKRVEVVVQ